VPNSMSLPKTHIDFQESAELHVQVFAQWQELQALREVWDALVEQNATRAYFLRYDWNQRWWQHFAPARSQLHVLVCRDAQGKVCGIAPLYRQVRWCKGFFLKVRELNFIGTGIQLVTSEHMDVLALRGHEDRVALSPVCLAIGKSLRQLKSNPVIKHPTSQRRPIGKPCAKAGRASFATTSSVVSAA
jgi:hypothetical protein